MHAQLQAIATVLALINPVVCAMMFMQAEAGRPKRAMWADASRAVLTVGVILALASLVGARILNVFGVSLDAFSVAGGGVLAWIGFGMLRGNTSPSASQGGGTSALTPLVLFAASPGTITGVITVAVAHSRLALPVTALVAVAIASAVLWLVIGLSIQASDAERDDGGKPGGSGGGFVHETVTHFMGLIVIAMGVQFALTGLRAFMQG